MIDRVTVKGSTDPIDIYTCDIDTSQLSGVTESKQKYKDKKHKRVLQRISRDERRKSAYEGTYKISQLFQEDEELKLMRSSISRDFLNKFNQGMQHYRDGNWDQAKLILEEANMIKPDGPSNTLLEVIEENGGRAPSDWNGFRVLTEK